MPAREQCPRCGKRHRKLPSCYYLAWADHECAKRTPMSWVAWKQVISEQFGAMRSYCTRMGWSVCQSTYHLKG
jgi:hypothetical protein